jgi:regulatory protein
VPTGANGAVPKTRADDAVQAALRLLRHRDRSAAQVERELLTRGFDEDSREQGLETLRRTGLVDDARFAQRRASALAGRGAGDALIRHELGAAGVPGEFVDEAVESLDGEDERAARVVERRGAGPKTARYLAGKGFSHDVIRAVVAPAGDETLG